ncbi:TRAP transporter substrate-binding protein [Ferrovibrio terrae]|uniref:TRAP transporter substrate-binding protein n=1 Tax=Ferrovibrio terrae TaxID=2594003 RepID=A0A516H3B6_9PROT|nr:TRAP transporter substrate-binding protein [Ferrovibrio terrae]QDO98261.1 TRAP transporter substrate-binding protein [Ferrovibrio terrae]
MTISRRRFLGTGATVAAGAAAAGLFPAPAVLAQGAPITFRVSSSMPVDPNAAHYIWFDLFQKALKAKVGERIRLDYFPNGQLGKEADVVQQVIIGSVDMMITGSSIWATAVPELGALDLGFLFDNYAHGAKALDAGVGKTFEAMLDERKGINVLGWGFHFGARSVYTRSKVENLAGLKSVKLRVLPAPAFIETFKIMGAVPVPIPVNELYTALQTGVVDGFEHDPATVLSNRFYEVSKFCLRTDHLFSPMICAIGKRGLAKVPANLKTDFLAAAREATIAERAIADTKATEAMKELEKLGVTFTAFPAADRAAIAKPISDTLYAQFMTQYPATKPVFDAIAKARG